MNTSFPPGPWTFTHEGGGSFYIRDNKGQQLIWIGNSTRLEKGECESLTRLLSAAPELFEALDELLAMFRKEAPGTTLNNHRFDALGIKCHTALAKARGESA